MIAIDHPMVSGLSGEAARSPRLRKNFNFHADYADPVNRMLNAFEPGTYVRPHKHESPDKWEVFIILTGRALVLRFNDAGTVIEHTVLDHAVGSYGVEIPPREWHSVISLTPGTVLYEIKPGPYAALEDKNFAAWAPSEGSPEAAAYMDSILARLL